MKLKGKRKIALYLLIPLLLMTGVLLVDFFYVRGKMADSAVQNAGSSARHVMNETRRNLSVTQTAVKNFLAMYSYQEHHIDEKTGEDITYLSVDLRDNTNATREAIYSSLEGFVVANITYVQPIYNRKKPDEVLVQMWVDINLDSLCELLDGEEPYPEARSFVLDNKMNIIANDDEELEGALSRLPMWRREKALAFRNPKGRFLSAKAYLLLKDGLMETYGLEEDPEFEYSASGKPSLKGRGGIHFNLSHCSCCVASVYVPSTTK